MLQAPDIRLSAAKGKLSSCLILSSRRLRMWRTRSGGDVPYSPSLGPEPADLGDVDMELPPQVSSAPAEAASFSEPSAPEFVQEDVEMEVETPQTIPVIDVCLCSERVRIGCLTSPDLLSEERFSVESISFQVELMTLKLWSFVDPKFAVEANRSSFGYHT